METNENSSVLEESVVESPESSQDGEQVIDTEYQQLVLQKLDSLVDVQSHQYVLGIFLTGCVSAVFVLYLLYRFFKQFY